MSDAIAAFFDLDYTILRSSSGRLFVRYLRQKGMISRRQEMAIATWSAFYMFRLIDYPRLMSRLIADIMGQDEASMWTLCQRWFDEMVVHYISANAREAIARHKAQGHLVAIVTASTPYAATPVAEHLGLDGNVLATRLEVRNGRFTGRVLGPACYGQGKVYWAERYAEEHGADLTRSYFYTDSANDLPLLERVGHPIAVNPDRRLRRIARARGWSIVSFR
ncbi:MAG TPA: HAD family hydrolase [Caldilineae bacterium]|nr:HAD family hydrolase [Caldilineae bacterium]